MSTALPPYSALPPEAPPLYSREETGEGETTEEHPVQPSEADHSREDPPPSILNEDVRAYAPSWCARLKPESARRALRMRELAMT